MAFRGSGPDAPREPLRVAGSGTGGHRGVRWPPPGVAERWELLSHQLPVRGGLALCGKVTGCPPVWWLDPTSVGLGVWCTAVTLPPGTPQPVASLRRVLLSQKFPGPTEARGGSGLPAWGEDPSRRPRGPSPPAGLHLSGDGGRDFPLGCRWAAPRCVCAETPLPDASQSAPA